MAYYPRQALHLVLPGGRQRLDRTLPSLRMKAPSTSRIEPRGHGSGHRVEQRARAHHRGGGEQLCTRAPGEQQQAQGGSEHWHGRSARHGEDTPFDHHDLALPVRQTLDLYLSTIGQGHWGGGSMVSIGSTSWARHEPWNPAGGQKGLRRVGASAGCGGEATPAPDFK